VVTAYSPPGSEPGSESNTRDQGATMVEYGITVTVIAFVAMVGVRLFSTRLGDLISNLVSW
jgi:Flp pilus assembly pilin Flp